MSIGSWVSDFWGSKYRSVPLTRRVALTTVLHYRADCDGDTRCSEALPLFKDGRATHLVCCAIRGSVACVSSCCSRPVSDSDQCLLVRMLCVYTWSTVDALPSTLPPTQWLAVTSSTMDRVSSGFQGVAYLLATVTDFVRCGHAICCNGCDNCKT